MGDAPTFVTLNYCILFAYSVMMFGIGLWFSGKQKTTLYGKSQIITVCKCGFFGCLILLSLAAKKSNIVRERSRLIEQRILVAGTASQGIALTEDTYYGATSKSICRFDTNWNLIEEKPIRIEGVNHMGATRTISGTHKESR